MKATLAAAVARVRAAARPRPRPPLPPQVAVDHVLVGGRLLDGTGEPPLDDAVVVVEGGLVVAAGPSSTTDVPRRSVVVELGGATVTPGVVDAHVHLAFARDPARMVQGGVTACRDLGWPPERLRPLVGHAWDVGLLVQWAGPMLTVPGGYPLRAAWAPAGTGVALADEAAAVAAVDAAVAGGACVVKVAMDDRVGPVLPLDLLTAIVERAGEWGRTVTAHAASDRSVATCLDAGVAELCHAPFGAEALAGDLVGKAVAAGVVLVPTLHCRHGGRDAGAAAETVRRWVAAGGDVAYGTDLGNAHTRPGGDATELAALGRAGLAPAAVVVAATSAAARLLGAPDLVGRIAPGLRADLLVLDDDPLTDVTALTRPRLVIAGGALRHW